MKLLSEITADLNDLSTNLGSEYSLGQRMCRRYVWETGNYDAPYLYIIITTHITALNASGGAVTRKDLPDLMEDLQLHQVRRELAVESGQEDMDQWDEENPAPIVFSWEAQEDTTFRESPDAPLCADHFMPLDTTDCSPWCYSSVEEAERSAASKLDSIRSTDFNVEALV